MSCGTSLLTAPPPPASEDNGSLGLGIALCEVAAVLLALGSDLQRYALAKIEPSTRLRCATRINAANAVWLSGLAIYFAANGVYVVAVSLAPAALCSALLATVVIANALISRWLLDERLKRCDYHGGTLIMAGIVLTSVFGPTTVVRYDALQLARLLSPRTNPAGFAYLVSVALAVSVLCGMVLWHERRERAFAAAELARERIECAAAAAVFIVCADEPSEEAPPASPAAEAAPASASTPSRVALLDGGSDGGSSSGVGSAGASAPASSPRAAADPPASRVPTALPPRCGGGDDLPPPPPSTPSPAGVVGVGSAPQWRAAAGSDAPLSHSWLRSLMPFAYPIAVGLFETGVQMAMKGGSSMLLLSFSGDSQLCHPLFWVVLLAWALLAVGAIIWLRKGLRHLPATRLLPVEYGTVSSASVLGGLLLYEEADLVSSRDLGLMMLGILLVCVGCGLVGRRKTIKRRYMPHNQVRVVGSHAVGMALATHRCVQTKTNPGRLLMRDSPGAANGSGGSGGGASSSSTREPPLRRRPPEYVPASDSGRAGQCADEVRRGFVDVPL